MRHPSACFKPVVAARLVARILPLAASVCSIWCCSPALAQSAPIVEPEQAVSGAATLEVSAAGIPPAITPEPAEGPAWINVGPPFPPELALPVLDNAPQPQQQPLPPAPPSAKLRPQRVLLVGDSLMQNGCLGSQLESRFAQYPGMQVARWAKQSTGLSRKDYFDWSAKLRELIGKYQPDLIVAIWGANDCQSVTNSRGKALAIFGTEAWDAAYGARVEEIAAVAHDAGAELVLIGLPSMHNAKYGARIARLNSVVEQHAQRAGGIYLPTWKITSAENGSCLANITYKGKQVPMRQKDGIHLSNSGAGYVSDWLMDELGKLFELPR